MIYFNLAKYSLFYMQRLNRGMFMQQEVNEDLIQYWIDQWGTPISEVFFDSKFNYFQIPGVQGFIGYYLRNGYAVSMGDPVCPEGEWFPLVSAFQEFCKEQKLRQLFVMASEKFSRWALEKNIFPVMIEIGEEIFFNPMSMSNAGGKGKKFRNNVQHASGEGVTVCEYLVPDQKIEHAIEQMGKEWESARKSPQIYVEQLNFFERREGRRWFYVTKEDRIIGAALLCRLQLDKGYLLKHLVALPDTPRGTTPLLVNYILETLRQEECSFLTYGMVPAGELGEMNGMGKGTQFMARGVFKVLKWVFKLNKRKIFWKQFNPQTAPMFLLSSSRHFGLRDIYNVVKFFTIKI